MNDLEKVLEIIRVSDPGIYNLLSDNFEYVDHGTFSDILKFKSNIHKAITLLVLEQYLEPSKTDVKFMYKIPLNLENQCMIMYNNVDDTISLYRLIFV